MPPIIKTLIFLWYMANQNSFKELGDKFNVAQSTAHDVVIQVLTATCHMVPVYIKGPSLCDKHICAGVFARWTAVLMDRYTQCNRCNRWLSHQVTAAKEAWSQVYGHGSDYINRKGYYSVLLHGNCGFFFIVTID